MVMWLVYSLGVVLPSRWHVDAILEGHGVRSVKINMLAKWGSWWAVAFKIFLGGNKHIQIGIVVVFQTLFSFLKEKPAI